MNLTVLDIESDGLLEEATLIYCLSYQTFKDGVLIASGTITDYNEMRSFVLSQEIIIGHNIIRYDIPLIKKILGLELSSNTKLYDTLGISWYLYPERLKHGLEVWGEEVGVAKPVIEDWKNQSLEDYINRCEQDVEINVLIWKDMYSFLVELYGNLGIDRILGYISFKLDCAREQEEMRWKVDVKLCEETLEELYKLREERVDNLVKMMPKVTIYKKALKPKIMFKKDGNLSMAGRRWYDNIREYGPSVEDVLTIPIGEEDGNPASTLQLKNWLFSLGWQPCTFDYKKNKDTGEVRAIPQVYDNGELTSSVKVLLENNPELENLEGLTIINHRIGILKGFLNNRDSEDFIKAEVKGFTNTMRFQHTTVVNLPTIHKSYGKNIRGALISPSEDYILCGSDMSSLEDNTKQHYMYFYDPEYVKIMRTPGFSAHLDIGVQGGMITQEESDFYTWFEATKSEDKVVLDLYTPKVTDRYKNMSPEEQNSEFKRIGGIRKDSKQVNFSAVYGVGPPKLSLTTGWKLEKSTELLRIYWERNWSVKTIATNTLHKTVRNKMWLYNPVSCFWYSLRYEKDKFSTLNQGTGVYCFDTWVKNVRKLGYKLCGQFHDEIIFPLKKTSEDLARRALLLAISRANAELKLNVELGISIDFGYRYSDIH